MPKTLIIGYGNPLRGDDGAGWRAARLLEERVRNPEVTVLARHQLTPELADNLRAADRAIFIDASAAQPPGTFVWREIQPRRAAPEWLSHDCDPPALLALAGALYGLCPQAYVVEIGGADFSYRDRLSPLVEERMAEVVDFVLARVEN
ncbi:MAG: hydrogenase maturation protease [bacterium]